MIGAIVYTVVGLLGLYLGILLVYAVYGFIKEHEKHPHPLTFKLFIKTLMQLKSEDIKYAIELARLKSKYARNKNLEKIKSEWKYQKEKGNKNE